MQELAFPDPSRLATGTYAQVQFIVKLFFMISETTPIVGLPAPPSGF